MLLKLSLCFCGTFFSYLVNGLVVEAISIRFGKELFSLYLLLVLLPCIFNVTLAYAVLKVRHVFYERKEQTTHEGPYHGNHEHAAVPQKMYLLCSMLATVAMTCTNASLAFIDFPSQLLLKSSKPIAIMIVSFVTTGRWYPLRRMLGVTLIVVGVVWFMRLQYLQKSQQNSSEIVADIHATQGTKHPAVSWDGWSESSLTMLGWFLLLVALVLDGLQAVVQEHMRCNYVVDSHLLMFHLNKFSVAILSCLVLFDREITLFTSFAYGNAPIIGYLFLLGTSSAVGQQFIFWTVAEFGPLTVSVITTTRKFFNLFISVVIFLHSMSYEQWNSVAIVFVGIFIDTFAQYSVREKTMVNRVHSF